MQRALFLITLLMGNSFSCFIIMLCLKIQGMLIKLDKAITIILTLLAFNNTYAVAVFQKCQKNYYLKIKL